MITKHFLAVSWVLQVTAAVILLQTLFFKFSGAEESRFIFMRLGVEPWGRWGSGVIELIAAVLLLHNRTAALGSLLSLGVMTGALLSHLFILGIAVKDDRGLLFALAVVVFVSSAGVLAIRRAQLPFFGHYFATPVP